MSTRLRLFVLAASTVLTVLALPDCCVVLVEELAQPLAEPGIPLLSHSAETSLPAHELLAMRAVDRASTEHEAADDPGARAER